MERVSEESVKPEHNASYQISTLQKIKAVHNDKSVFCEGCYGTRRSCAAGSSAYWWPVTMTHPTAPVLLAVQADFAHLGIGSDILHSKSACSNDKIFCSYLDSLFYNCLCDNKIISAFFKIPRVC